MARLVRTSERERKDRATSLEMTGLGGLGSWLWPRRLALLEMTDLGGLARLGMGTKTGLSRKKQLGTPAREGD